MTMLRTRRVGDVIDRTDQDVDFGFIDPRGRHMGVRFTTFEATYEPIPADENPDVYSYVPPGHHFGLICQVIRDGQPYGYSPPTKRFKSSAERDIAIRHYAEQARYRAAQIGRTPSGERIVSPTARSDRARQRAKGSRKNQEKLVKKQARDAKIANEIPQVEAAVQALLDDPDFMDYLKSYPWPVVIPGPPSMAYTAYDHIVVKGLRYVEYHEREGTPGSHLAELKSLLRLLKEQQRRRDKGLLPDSDTIPGFVRAQMAHLTKH